ncbi:MAG: winged helix-turn-helix domain-containing protein [Gammaproteobacteria bacterium]
MATASRRRLQRVALQRQGLSGARPFGRGLDATLSAVEHLGYVQIDTLAVVERAHHHTLWTRVPDYQPQMLHQLVYERRVFEYWSHAASYLPMRDYRFALPRMMAARRGELVYAKAQPKYLREVSARIRGDGPLKARDFEAKSKRKGSWWNWKQTKRALEQLFTQGDLMISGRDGMEKIYDLAERVLPSATDTREPSLAELADYLVKTALRANGFTTLKQLAHLRPGRALRDALAASLAQQMEAETVVELAVEGMPTVYADQAAINATLPRTAATLRLLSPFDNAVIHRDRVEQLFAFNYRMECYLPKSKRQFGYFCLPILFRDQLIGQVDCKAHRTQQHFEMIHVHLNTAGLEPDQWLPAFRHSVRRFAAFNHCTTIAATKVSPRKLTGVLRKAFG